MGQSEEDAVHKIPHKMNASAESAENLGIGLI